MSEDINRLYRRALKAIAKERRQSTGRKRIHPELRGVAKLHARWAAESPVYRALEEKRKLPVPPPKRVKQLQRQHALKEIVRGYRSGWGRKRVAPEHRESILKHAAQITKSGETFIPRRTAEAMTHARVQRKNVKVARLNSEWLTVDSVKGDKSDGRPYLIGPGVGYDVHRLVVFASSEDEAYEIAQETWPKSMYSEFISRKKLDKLAEENPEETERYEYVSKLNRWGIPEEDIRILKAAKEFYRNAKEIGLHLYRLPDGRIIEAK